MRAGTLTNVLSTGVLPSFGYRFERSTGPRLDALRRAAMLRPTVSVIEVPSLEVVEIPAESTVLFFTRDGHFAHRSLLVRRIVQPASGPAIEVQGYTTADDDAMSTWIEQFRASDGAMRRTIRDDE